jgi:CBS domain-containing protein
MSLAVVVDQDAPVRDALALLLSEQVGALPVVDGWRRLRGIVSYVDVLRHFGES